MNVHNLHDLSLHLSPSLRGLNLLRNILVKTKNASLGVKAEAIVQQ